MIKEECNQLPAVSKCDEWVSLGDALQSAVAQGMVFEQEADSANSKSSTTEEGHTNGYVQDKNHGVSQS